MRKIKILLVAVLAMIGVVSLFAVGCNSNEKKPDEPSVEYSILISEKTLSLEIYDTAALTVKTENVTETLKFASSNTQVASVDAAGTVKALKAGTANITVSANGVSDTCVLTVTDSGYKPTLELSGEQIFIDADSYNIEAKVKFNGNYVTEGVSITWSVLSGNTVKATPIENTLKASLSSDVEGHGFTTFLVTATFNGVEISKTFTASLIQYSYTLSFDAPITYDGEVYSLSKVVKSSGAMATVDLGDLLTVNSGSGPVVNYNAVYSQTAPDVASISDSGVVTAIKPGTTIVTVDVDGDTESVVLSFDRIVEDKTSDVISFEMLDRGALTSSTYRYLDSYDLQYDFTTIEGTKIEKVMIAETEVFNGAQSIETSGETTVTLNLENLSNVNVDAVSVYTDLGTYTYTADIYTMVLKTKEDVQKWIDVAKNVDLAGKFVLGNDITSSDYWDYSAKSINDVGAFTGTFDGNGYYIEKMNLVDSSMQTAFLPTNSGTVKDVAFVGCRLTLSADFNQCGFLTQTNNGTISNVYMDVEMVAGDYGWAYSGFVAMTLNGSVENVILKVTGSLTKGVWINYASFSCYTQNAPKDNLYLITDINSATDTDQGNAVMNFKHGNCTAKYDNEAEMASSGEDFDEIFTSDVWTIVEGVPKFASTLPQS